MGEIMNWVIGSKEWLIPVIGLVASIIGGLIYKKKCSTTNQNIQSGRYSENFQAGRDISFKSKKDRNNVEKD